MARQARSREFDSNEVGIYHCINRCVRRCILCGIDPLTNKDYGHRKNWMLTRLEKLAAAYAIDVIGFSFMGNHFHVILRNRPDVCNTWSNDEVARRWLMLCPKRKLDDGTPATPTASEIRGIVEDSERLAEIGRRLSDISWFMKMFAEWIANRANAEDEVTGRFWEGRFKMKRICDDAALLACLIYVDLNPIRAQLASLPEESEHTSARLRIDAHLRRSHVSPRWLAPLERNESDTPEPFACVSGRCSNKGVIPVQLEEYLVLLDWTGRQVARGKSGKISRETAPILSRLGIEPSGWLTLVTKLETLFYRVVGSPRTLAEEAKKRGRRWYQAPGRFLLRIAAA